MALICFSRGMFDSFFTASRVSDRNSSRKFGKEARASMRRGLVSTLAEEVLGRGEVWRKGDMVCNRWGT